MRHYPAITLITVTFNAQDTIERTLKSVEEQTYQHIEHIIIDGCSGDNTLSHIRRYVERNQHPKGHAIRTLCEPDEGLYDAMNKGIRLATGNYLVFLNAGDKLHAPDTLERMAEQIDWDPDSRNYAVVYGQTNLVDNEGKFIRERRLKAPEKLTWDTFRWGMLVCHQSFYVRTDLAKAVTYDLNYRFSADYDWSIRVMKLGESRRLQNLNTHQVLTDYLSEGLTTKNHRKSLAERFQVMARHWGKIPAAWQHLLFVFRAVIKR